MERREDEKEVKIREGKVSLFDAVCPTFLHPSPPPSSWTNASILCPLHSISTLSLPIYTRPPFDTPLTIRPVDTTSLLPCPSPPLPPYLDNNRSVGGAYNAVLGREFQGGHRPLEAWEGNGR